MSGLLSGRFSSRVIRTVLRSRNKSLLCGAVVPRGLHRAAGRRPLLLSKQQLWSLQVQRGIASKLLREALKLRYWILGGGVAGGLTLGQRYDNFKQSLPDLPDITWITDSLRPATDAFASVNISDWIVAKRDAFEGWGRHLMHFNGLNDPETERIFHETNASETSESNVAHSFMEANSTADESSTKPVAEMSDQERYEKLQEQILATQSQYQNEVDRLQQENKQLRRQILLTKDRTTDRKTKKSVIDMYSEVLDFLSDYDSSYSSQDNLPRVVVVGDQSSGKTSVLEMIARARIFPRGSGQMMTRAPVKVTLSEGPYHVATFRDNAREFDLTKEAELKDLRKEIELRMLNSVKQGKTVSNEVISLSVKGPDLPRMVLVDLPGVISTVTADMARETKDDIVNMCKTYMQNPNAIVLCIQDGSVDAERSNVTDLVSAMDPKGNRTILVLTKVDLAETNATDPQRIKKILEGKLFPMKAIGYYAVVTGRGNSHDSIETIRQYEQDFFKKSRLFKEGVLRADQITATTMSLAVSKCFWKMVKDSIEQQADAFRATTYNLETEWKNTFPTVRQLDRDELYEKARGEILDEIVNLSQQTSQHWQQVLQTNLWQKMSPYVFENVLLPAARKDSVGSFNTLTDIKLKHWADKELPVKAVQVGWDSLKEHFLQQVHTKDSKHDTVFQPLKEAVLNAAIESHQWDQKAVDYLRIIQLSALEDRSIHDKSTWDEALKFMDSALRDRLNKTNTLLNRITGPSTLQQWTHWKYVTPEEITQRETVHELHRLIHTEPDHPQALRTEDFTVVRRNLENRGISGISDEVIRSSWHEVYRKHFLERSLRLSRECRSFFYHYQKGFNDDEVDCQAVVLFSRVQRMINLTSNALRQQITNTEQSRLEKRIKDVLEEWAADTNLKSMYLNGKRVELAEQLKQVRHIQEKLEEFIEALKHEKTS